MKSQIIDNALFFTKNITFSCVPSSFLSCYGGFLVIIARNTPEGCLACLDNTWREFISQYRDLVFSPPYISEVKLIGIYYSFVVHTLPARPFLPSDGAWAVSRLGDFGPLRGKQVGCICLYQMLFRMLLLSYCSFHRSLSLLCSARL